MQILPVIDLLNGVVVRGVAGQRQSYRPIQSRLTPSHSPAVVLEVMTTQLHMDACYIADLDAIQFRRLNRCLLAELVRTGVTLMVDRGVRTAADVEELLELGIQQVVVALETLPDLEMARQLVAAFETEQLLLSLDLKGGIPCTSITPLQTKPVADIADEFWRIGFRSFIVLDVADVGVDGGITTLSICRDVRLRHPAARIITGGGVRGLGDLRSACSAGVDAVLVASALHDGRLTAADINSF